VQASQGEVPLDPGPARSQAGGQKNRGGPPLRSYGGNHSQLPAARQQLDATPARSLRPDAKGLYRQRCGFGFNLGYPRFSRS